MRKMLNVLYVTSPDAYLARDGENVVIRIKGDERARFPVHNLEGVVTFGYTGCSPALMELCCERGAPITFLNVRGSFLARVSGKVTGNVLLRRRQYRAADDLEFSCTMSRWFVTGKVLNSRAVLLRFLRDHGPNDEIAQAAASLMAIGEALQEQITVAAIRGMEGEAARIYFSVFSHLLVAQADEFAMTSRSRRPPLDRINALLSFLYSLLTSECVNALESVGLDPQVGYLHADRPGRYGLALDLMEELRPHLADRLALSLVNTKQISAAGFDKRESGAVLMEDKTRKAVLAAWQKRKQEEVMHPFLGERVPIGLVPYAQALILARYLRGDIDGYPPFVFR